MPIHMRMRKLRGPHMKKSMPFEMFRTHTQPVNIGDLEARFDAGAEVTIELMQGRRPGHPQGHADQDPRQGRAEQGADRPRPRVQRRRPRAHRGRGRHLPDRRELDSGAPRTRSPRAIQNGPRRLQDRPLKTHALDDPQRLPGSGDPQEARLHGGDAADLPPRLAHPRAGRQPDRGQQHPEGVRRLGHPRLPEPVLRRRPVANRDVRAGDHALHHLLDHPAAAAGGGAVAGEALQGRRGRAGADHPVHPLPDGRPGVRAVDRVRVPVPLAAGQSRRIGRHALRRAAHLPDRDLPDDRLRAADVDRRADHPARASATASRC